MLRTVSKPAPFRQLSSSAPLWNSNHVHGVPDRPTKEPVSGRSLPSSQSQAATNSLPSPRHSNYVALDSVKKLLKEWTETAAVAVRNRADDFTSRTQSTFSQLGSQMNRVTGYEEIEELKRQVVRQGSSGRLSLLSIYIILSNLSRGPNKFD